jgi:hypothetical protein
MYDDMISFGICLLRLKAQRFHGLCQLENGVAPQMYDHVIWTISVNKPLLKTPQWQTLQDF